MALSRGVVSERAKQPVDVHQAQHARRLALQALAQLDQRRALGHAELARATATRCRRARRARHHS
eukprot:2985598-Prymnesium_polylepis.1